MSPEQEDAVDTLAGVHGRVHVRTGYADGYVEVTSPRGACWRVAVSGYVREVGPDHSVDWRQDETPR